MYSESRVTRSRARIATQNGQTPGFAALPTDAPATTRTGRKATRRSVTDCPPAVLFDITNTEIQEEGWETKTPSVTEKTVPEVGPTPTGLGLSSLPPVTPGVPQAPTEHQGRTPQPTPAHGLLPSGTLPGVESALKAAAKVLGGSEDALVEATPVVSAPTLAPAPFTSAYFSPVGTLSPCDFSTPPESPCASISVGDAIAAAVACSPGVDSASPGVDSASPAPASAPPMGPRIVTVLGPSSASAFPASPEQEEAAPAFPSPLGSGTKASADTPNGNAGTPATAGTAAAGMPGLSPAFLFIAAGAAAGAAEREPPTAASPEAATAVNSALAREVEELGDQTIEEEGAEDTPPLLAATVAGTDAVLPQGRPRVASKVSVPSSGFDSRSLRQLKKEVAARMAASASQAKEDAPKDCEDEIEKEEEEEEEEYDAYGEEEAWEEEQAGAEDLTSALAGLELGPEAKLRGVPTPVGTHIRFDEDDEVEPVAGPEPAPKLKGVATPQGRHIRFDD
ncbi:hypothetical protein ACKKBF_B11215 [Auxenochlorella protothecoides x Auxenochlorella symbiontica]